MQLEEGSAVGHYVLGPPLGAGGVAAVYRARHQVLGSEHAIKLILLPKARDRVLREGRVQANLRHPNIVAVTDYLVIRGTPALVMDYVDGPTLERLLDRHRLTLTQIDLLADGLFAAVAAAHEQRFVHRDLKPSNILLARTATSFVAKVADFGLVKVLEDEQALGAVTNTTMGTPAYMAPEQFRDTASVDHRADIFALGCVLYEMVTGLAAFDGRDPYAIQRLVSSGEYKPVAELTPSAPVGVMAAIERALSADPSLRPDTVDGMRALWFAGRSLPEGADAWPREWLEEDWSPPPADIAGLTWDASEEASGPLAPVSSMAPGPLARPIPAPSPPAIDEDDDDEETERRLGRGPLLWVVAALFSMGLVVVLGVALLWALGSSAVSGRGESALGLTPSDDLVTALRGRDQPLVVLVGSLRPVGVEETLTGSLSFVITEKLRATHGIDVKTGALEPDATVDQWLVTGRRAGADTVLVGAVGERDGDTVIRLDRIDTAAGRVRARRFAVLGKDLAADMEALLAATLSRDETRTPSDVVLDELKRRQAAMDACKPKRGTAEVRWRADDSGTAQVISADAAIALCARAQIATWVLPPGTTGDFTWQLGR